MALQIPLIWDDAHGVSKQLDPADGLRLQGGLQAAGPLSFYGAAPVAAAAPLNGNWGNSVDQLITALVKLGLFSDSRPAGWRTGLDQVVALGGLGPYEPGRLVIGSVTGWLPLDQPALEPGVIQVPAAHAGAAETRPGSSTPVQTLAYSPLLAFKPTAPAGKPQPGALWFDSSKNLLKVWTGTAWAKTDPAGLEALLKDLTGLAAGQLIVSNGLDGLQLLNAGQYVPGAQVVLDASNQAAWAQLITVGTTPPWSNGASAFGPAPNGQRPAGVAQAIWCNPAINAETLGFWDEASASWKTTYVNNPLLNQLAELRTTVADGDLFTLRSGKLSRLPAGSDSQTLRMRVKDPQWHSGFSRQATAPTGSLEGDLWLDTSSDVLWLRSGGAWRDVDACVRCSDVNGTGATVIPGTPLVHNAPSWQMAGPGTARDSAVAIATASAAAGLPLSAAVSGVVSLSTAEWSAVIDSAEVHPANSGLLSGRMYYVSDLTAGLITSKPTPGRELPVGLAVSATQLLLRPAAPLSDRAARASTAAVAPAAPLPGTLWWNDASKRLEVWSSTGAGGFLPAMPAAASAPGGGTGGGGGSGGGAAVALSAVEAIDWIPDPLAGGIRFSLSDGSTETIRLRGAGGAQVTMADNRTLVIDAGGSSGGSGLGPGGADGGRFSP